MRTESAVKTATITGSRLGVYIFVARRPTAPTTTASSTRSTRTSSESHIIHNICDYGFVIRNLELVESKTDATLSDIRTRFRIAQDAAVRRTQPDRLQQAHRVLRARQRLRPPSEMPRDNGTWSRRFTVKCKGKHEALPTLPIAMGNTDKWTDGHFTIELKPRPSTRLWTRS